MKKEKTKRICKNYARSCAFANRCANCKHRVMRSVYDRAAHEKKLITLCAKKHDMEGDTSECFTCSAEGTRCKNE